MCLPETLAALHLSVGRRTTLKAAAAVAVGATLPQAARAAPLQQTALRYSRVVDLTHVLGINAPLFPGYDPVTLRVVRTFEDNGYYANRIDFVEHSGTHMDAPAHFDPAGLSVDRLPAEQLVGPLAIVDISERAARDADAMVMPDDLLAWERRYGRLPERAIVLMNSGWATRVGDAEAFKNTDASGTLHFPGWSKAATDVLLNERNVIGIGVDTLSLDFGASIDFGVHTSWLPSGRWGLECVANLSDAPPVGATLVVGAPKIYGGSGGPTRLLALF